jgi:ABC-2 type transport system ATP-binding protein
MFSTDAVRVRNLTYEYPGVRALDDVSFAVARGSVTALVGPNGAGKTTLLRCMAALDQPLEGAIDVDGIDVLEHPRECHRRIGYLSDFFGLYASLTVRQCLAYAASSQGIADQDVEQAVNTTAARLNLVAKLDAASDNLSRGQRQRVAIGQALIHAPGLLILDEPASGLDPEARHELAGLFKQLRASGMTLIVSSHILAELDEYSTHMLVMRGGRIVESRALAEANTVDGLIRVRVLFADCGDTLAERVGAVAGARPSVQLQSCDETSGQAILTLPADALARAELLRALIEARLPVISFADERENLHESYLRTMKSTPPGIAPEQAT